MVRPDLHLPPSFVHLARALPGRLLPAQPSYDRALSPTACALSASPSTPAQTLTDVLERIVSGRTKAHEMHTLLPWTWAKANASLETKALAA